MINVRTIRKLTNNDGLTLRAGRPVRYKSGWQVATEGVECSTPEQAMRAVKSYGGNCGLWVYKNAEGQLVYCVDKSRRVDTKREAMDIGRRCNQQSILRWANMGLVFC